MQQIKKKIIAYILKKLNYVSYPDQPFVNYTEEKRDVLILKAAQQYPVYIDPEYLDVIKKQLTRQLVEGLFTDGFISFRYSALDNGTGFAEVSIKVIK